MSKTPKLRFPEFSGEWQHKKLYEIVERVIRKNKGVISKMPLTISAQYGLIDQEKFFNKTVASSNLEGYYLLYNGDFAYNKSYSNGYPFGTIKRLDKYDMGVVSSLYICFKPLDTINSEYIVQYFETNKWHKEVSMIAVEGARNHGLLNIAVSDFFETLHYMPCNSEQQKIASFLSLVDKKIEKQSEKVEAIKEYKKGMMQKIFSREIRFKDDEGKEFPEWEEKKLSDIGSTYSGLSGKTKDNFGIGDSYYITYVNVFSNTLADNLKIELVQVDEKEKQNKVVKGDLLFTTSSETPNEVGMVSCWNYQLDNIYLNSFCFGYRINDKTRYSPIFIAYILRSVYYRNQIRILAQGSTRYNISKNQLINIKIMLPCTQEQCKIVEFILSIDKKLEKEEEKLEALKTWKKGLLQQMFV